MSRQWISAAVLACTLGFSFPNWMVAQQPATTPPPSATPKTPATGGQTGQSQTQGQGQAPASQTGSSDDSAFKIVTSVNEVNLIFTVTDKHGRFIPNLKQSDFALLDDQKAPARISSFTQQTNLPLRVGIVIDASTSIRSRFQFEQQSATEFLLGVVKSRSDRAFVMGFDSTPDVTQDWTNNLDALQTGVNKLRPGGGTALFDAVYTACRDKLLDVSRGQEPVRRAMVLVSDGNDNQSRAYVDDAIKMCQRSETIIYAISTNWTPSRGKGDDVLQKMAEATGGRAFFPPSVDEMALGFSSIQEELRSQYALTYTPADFKADGAFRTIYLFANDRRYQVRARKGYFSPKQ
ncbi:VWA domain-containing protein [Acidicapsa acidisoli]|uniref:VWA domain-containing protein n=1 Tax=Acidicapsa acidisoli TaxID=1615681 RepID=UPI0021E0EF52|nr:VWA domain-containing protein [Acidicapsa acidisoli]